MKPQTITAFARRFGLSRSTLLYYDRIGLLKPSSHSASGYRLYNEADAQRMRRIGTFRSAGLPLKTIQKIMASGPGDTMERALEARLASLNDELSRLRAQQQLVIKLLQHRERETSEYSGVSVHQWVSMLEEAGMDERARERWHHAFERDAPKAHAAFLQSLGLSEEEIGRIRALSRGAWAN